MIPFIFIIIAFIALLIFWVFFHGGNKTEIAQAPFLEEKPVEETSAEEKEQPKEQVSEDAETETAVRPTPPLFKRRASDLNRRSSDQEAQDSDRDPNFNIPYSSHDITGTSSRFKMYSRHLLNAEAFAENRNFGTAISIYEGVKARIRDIEAREKIEANIGYLHAYEDTLRDEEKSKEKERLKRARDSRAGITENKQTPSPEDIASILAKITAEQKNYDIKEVQEKVQSIQNEKDMLQAELEKLRIQRENDRLEEERRRSEEEALRKVEENRRKEEEALRQQKEDKIKEDEELRRQEENKRREQEEKRKEEDELRRREEEKRREEAERREQENLAAINAKLNEIENLKQQLNEFKEHEIKTPISIDPQPFLELFERLSSEKPVLKKPEDEPKPEIIEAPEPQEEVLIQEESAEEPEEIEAEFVEKPAELEEEPATQPEGLEELEQEAVEELEEEPEEQETDLDDKLPTVEDIVPEIIEDELPSQEIVDELAEQETAEEPELALPPEEIELHEETAPEPVEPEEEAELESETETDDDEFEIFQELLAPEPVVEDDGLSDDDIFKQLLTEETKQQEAAPPPKVELISSEAVQDEEEFELMKDIIEQPEPFDPFTDEELYNKLLNKEEPSLDDHFEIIGEKNKPDTFHMFGKNQSEEYKKEEQFYKSLLSSGKQYKKELPILKVSYDFNNLPEEFNLSKEVNIVGSTFNKYKPLLGKAIDFIEKRKIREAINYYEMVMNQNIPPEFKRMIRQNINDLHEYVAKYMSGD